MPRSAKDAHPATDHRRTWGVYYTPEPLARRLAEDAVRAAWRRARPQSRTPQDALARFRLADPACGNGALLGAAAEALRLLVVAEGLADDEARRRIVRLSILGIDLDPDAVAEARRSLARWAGDSPEPPGIVAGDALDLGLTAASQRPSHADPASGPARSVGDPFAGWSMADSGGIDVIVGNPPFVDSERMVRAGLGWVRDAARRRFAVARGNWDYAALFVERALPLLRPGGQGAFLLPRRILASRHAAALHEWLLAHGLRAIEDVPDGGFEDAGAPVVLLRFESGGDPETPVRFYSPELRILATVAPGSLRSLPAGCLGAPLVGGWTPELAAAASHRGQRLGDIAQVGDGASTHEAYALRGVLTEAAGSDPPDGWIRVVNTGTIGAGRLRWGEKPMRYLGRSYARPVVSRADLRRVAPGREAQADSWKVVVAGLAATVRAAVAPPGVLAAKSTVVCVVGSEGAASTLSASLNRAETTRLYRALFGLRGFSPAAMAIGARQLEQMPLT